MWRLDVGGQRLPNLERLLIGLSAAAQSRRIFVHRPRRSNMRPMIAPHALVGRRVGDEPLQRRERRLVSRVPRRPASEIREVRVAEQIAQLDLADAACSRSSTCAAVAPQSRRRTGASAAQWSSAACCIAAPRQHVGKPAMRHAPACGWLRHRRRRREQRLGDRDRTLDSWRARPAVSPRLGLVGWPCASPTLTNARRQLALQRAIAGRLAREPSR